MARSLSRNSSRGSTRSPSARRLKRATYRSMLAKGRKSPHSTICSQPSLHQRLGAEVRLEDRIVEREAVTDADIERYLKEYHNEIAAKLEERFAEIDPWRALSDDTFSTITKLLILTGQRRGEIKPHFRHEGRDCRRLQEVQLRGRKAGSHRAVGAAPPKASTDLIFS
jgi:hypothetical protein